MASRVDGKDAYHRFEAGEKWQDIATRYGCSEATVRRHARRWYDAESTPLERAEIRNLRLGQARQGKEPKPDPGADFWRQVMDPAAGRRLTAAGKCRRSIAMAG